MPDWGCAVLSLRNSSVVSRSLAWAALLAILIGFPVASVGFAEPAPEPIDRGNLPPGWQWPPSEAMRLGGEHCMQSLLLAGVDFEPRPQAVGKIATPVVVPSMTFSGLSVRQVFGERAPVMDCHMALALVRHSRALQSLGIREILAAGFFQNRQARLGGRTLPMLSRHALGLAVDIRGFVTTDGRTLAVQSYETEPLFQHVESALLSSKRLRAVVTPGNDRGHKNHFHISAMMLIEGQQPDEPIDVAEILALVR